MNSGMLLPSLGPKFIDGLEATCKQYVTGYRGKQVS
jgi:hypothetical protein